MLSTGSLGRYSQRHTALANKAHIGKCNTLYLRIIVQAHRLGNRGWREAAMRIKERS